MGCGVAKVFQSIAAHCDSNPLLFFFVWSQGGDQSGVRDVFVRRDGGARDEEDRVRALLHPVAHPLREAADIVRQGFGPDGSIRARAKVAVLKVCAGCFIEDGVCFM